MMEVQPDPVMSIECVLVATALLSVGVLLSLP